LNALSKASVLSSAPSSRAVVKYLNNIVEQDHRAIKRMTKAMLEFNAFYSATITIAGIEIMHMIYKGQLRPTGKLPPAQQFYSLAA
jgi:putative transposase